MTASAQSTPSIACTSVARQATTGASEIESSILARSSLDAGSSLPAELQALQALAGKLRQLATSATQLRDTLDSNVSSSSPSSSQNAARDALVTGLPGVDAAATTLVKQLMRCGRDTPAQRISLAAVLTYDHFVGTAASFLSLMASMATRSQQQSNPTRDAADIDTLLARVSGACADVSSSGGILLDGGVGNATQPLSLLDTDNEAMPPVYEMQAPTDNNARDQPPPPSFEASSRNLSDSGYEDWDGDKKGKHHEQDAPAYSPGAWEQGHSSGEEKTGGNRLTKTPSPKKGFFAGLKDALRPKPEPLVVALCEAAARGEVGQMRSLVAQKVNVDGRNEQGRTALICAVLADQPEAVAFLIGSDARADATVCDDTVGSGLTSGSSRGGKYGKPPLYHAVEARNMRIAELLLADKGAGGRRLAGQKDDFGESFFARCVLGGDAVPARPWLEMLLAHGADAAHKDLTGRPLVLAVLDSKRESSGGRRDSDVEEVVSLLLRHGASPSSRDADGTALLHRAVEQGRTKLALQLVELGADANGKDLSGSPVLLAALKRGDRELVKALLEHGADPNVKDLYGSRLLAVVQKMSSLRPEERDAMMVLMVEHGAKK